MSRGNLGAVRVLQRLAPAGRLQFVEADLGDLSAVERLFARNHFDAVMHFAAVAFVGESVEQPLQYYHNITANTLTLLEAMQRHAVKRLIYSSTCATYGEPDTMPITEDTPQVRVGHTDVIGPTPPFQAASEACALCLRMAVPGSPALRWCSLADAGASGGPAAAADQPLWPVQEDGGGHDPGLFESQPGHRVCAATVRSGQCGQAAPGGRVVTAVCRPASRHKHTHV